MSSPSDLTRATHGASPAPRRPWIVAWPLWAVLAGAAGTVGTVATDLRPDAELQAFLNGEPYTVTAADMTGLDPLLGRIGYGAGLIAILSMLVFSAAWRRHVDARLARSTAARIVSAGLIAAAGAVTLGYGWRGALSNYLGSEAGLYDENGLFVYYILTDFGAYLGWTTLIASSLGIAWMAFAERSVSRILGGLAAVAGLGTILAVLLTGVPGLPGVLLPVWLAVTGLWLALGRSHITRTGQ